MFLLFANVVIVIVLALFLFTQIILPLVGRTQLFPLFRKKESLKHRLDDLEDREDVIDLAEKVSAKEKVLVARERKLK